MCLRAPPDNKSNRPFLWAWLQSSAVSHLRITKDGCKKQRHFEFCCLMADCTRLRRQCARNEPQPRPTESAGQRQSTPAVHIHIHIEACRLTRHNNQTPRLLAMLNLCHVPGPYTVFFWCPSCISFEPPWPTVAGTRDMIAYGVKLTRVLLDVRSTSLCAHALPGAYVQSPEPPKWHQLQAN